MLVVVASIVGTRGNLSAAAKLVETLDLALDLAIEQPIEQPIVAQACVDEPPALVARCAVRYSSTAWCRWSLAAAIHWSTPD